VEARDAGSRVRNGMKNLHLLGGDELSKKRDSMKRIGREEKIEMTSKRRLFI